MAQIDILEVKLEPGDTRESILAKKVRAELSYQKVIISGWRNSGLQL